jgi:hypothetical protein
MPSLYTRTSVFCREHASPPKLLTAVGKGRPLLAGRGVYHSLTVTYAYRLADMTGVANWDLIHSHRWTAGYNS